MRLIIDFWIDGYKTEDEMEAAAPGAAYELLSSAGTSVKVVPESEENKRLRGALERCREILKELQVAWTPEESALAWKSLRETCEEVLK